MSRHLLAHQLVAGARQAYRDALAVIERVASGLADESLRETFLNSEHVQSILRGAEAAG